jgi:hypothetical protein
MRSYILTDRERNILKRFVDTGEKLDGFAVLIHHLKKHKLNIIKDLELVNVSLQQISPDIFDDVADNALKRVEEKKKSRLRTRGPYRKAHVETKYE